MGRGSRSLVYCSGGGSGAIEMSKAPWLARVTTSYVEPTCGPPRFVSGFIVWATRQLQSVPRQERERLQIRRRKSPDHLQNVYCYSANVKQYGFCVELTTRTER